MSYQKSQAGIGLGSILSIGSTGATPTFTLVGEIKTINQSGRQVSTEDTTNLQSYAKEFIPTLLDSGSIDISGNRIGTDAGQIAMEAAFVGLQVLPFTIQLPKQGTQTTKGNLFAFNALVQESNFSAATDKAITFTAKIKVSGAITLTAGS